MSKAFVETNKTTIICLNPKNRVEVSKSVLSTCDNLIEMVEKISQHPVGEYCEYCQIAI